MEALNYLYFLGHRKIGFVGVKGNSVSNCKRYAAYLDFLAEKELPVQNDIIWSANSFDQKSGVEAAKLILENGIQSLPQSLYCIDDEITIGIMYEFSRCGLRVPDDISIVGFDNLYLAEIYNLTTIHQDRNLIGIKAAEKLIRIIQEGDSDCEDITVKTKLVVRTSCKRY
jgi:DNA-binding LacI/PurR family transcriptional regulator